MLSTIQTVKLQPGSTTTTTPAKSSPSSPNPATSGTSGTPGAMPTAVEMSRRKQRNPKPFNFNASEDEETENNKEIKEEEINGKEDNAENEEECDFVAVTDTEQDSKR